MEDEREGIGKLPPVAQIGIVVRDVDEAVRYYKSIFGLGPFETFEWNLRRFTYRGKESSGRLKIAVATSGPVQIELIEPLQGETSQSEFLREKGEGIQHLGFWVDDLEARVAALALRGVKPVFEYRTSTMTDTFYDSQFGGFLFQLTRFSQSVST